MLTPSVRMGRPAIPSDRLRERRSAGRRREGSIARVLRRPDQRDRLGEVADIVVGVGEQHLVDAFGDQRAQHRRLDAGDVEVAGERRQRIAAVGVRRGAEIVGHQPQLGVPLGRQHEPVEEGGEGAHGRP